MTEKYNFDIIDSQGRFTEEKIHQRKKEPTTGRERHACKQKNTSLQPKPKVAGFFICNQIKKRKAPKQGRGGKYE